MVPPLLDELRSFQAFLARKIEERDAETLSPEECLDLWRLEHPAPEEHEDAIQAIREGLKDIDEGRTMPFDDFDRAFRARNGMQSRP